MESRELPDGSFLLKALPGEEAVAALTAFAQERSLFSGVVTGIGAVSEAEIAFFDPERKVYEKTLLKGPREVLALNGNLSRVDGRAFLHAHVVLGERDFSTRGGHLFRAVAHPTLELHLRSWPEPVERRFEEWAGLRLWSLGAQRAPRGRKVLRKATKGSR